jgi:hypothetical protein
MDVSCSAVPCPVILDCFCVRYTGANLIYTGIVTNDTLCDALVKIDAKFQDAGIGYIFNNGIIQSAPGDPVQLGGALIRDTTIAGSGYDFTFTGDFYASKFVTIGGTSSQFVKGDGSLDGTTYQPAGNYITSLTGDGTASGPGSSAFTLAPVSALYAGTWGSATQVPRFVLDSKGRVLSVTNVPITMPSSSLSFNGDVTGFGNTGSPVTLTLATVLSSPGTYGSGTNIPVITVNGKGLITSISQVPFSGGTGTVTSVGVTAGTGISASVSNPTTTPNITITNTAPDQTVVLNNGTGISVTGTYPNFTISATGGGGSGTVTSVQLSAGTGISLSGTNPITTSGTITVTNSAPDQTVSLTPGTGISVSGTYPNFTITNTGLTSNPNLSQVLTAGNTAIDKSIQLSDSTGTSNSFLSVTSITSGIQAVVYKNYIGVQALATDDYIQSTFSGTTPYLIVHNGSTNKESRVLPSYVQFKDLVSGKIITLNAPATINNQTLTLPDGTGTLVRTVNGNTADVNGNVTVSTGSSVGFEMNFLLMGA